MNDVIINNGENVVVNHFVNNRANKIWNVGSWVKSLKLGKIRIYLTYNQRMKARNKRDMLFSMLKQPKHRWNVYNKQGGICAMCGKHLEYKKCELHHVLPFNNFLKYASDESNMEVLCHKCHKSIHCNPFLQSRLISERCELLGINVKDYYDV